MAADREIDPLSGTPTTGHEWDGVRELNTPLPRWWLWLFYLTIIWSIGYWILYPSWPLVARYTTGLSGWHSREAVMRDLAELNTQRGPMLQQLRTASLKEIVADPQLLDFARALGRPAFAENCAACHGAGGGGGKGFPNLLDDDWLWGGSLDAIAQTIRVGIRSTHAETRAGSMPAFGRDNIVPRADLLAVADYTRSLSGLPVPPDADLTRGAKVFADVCAACHGQDGRGNRELGAPNLTDSIWLYGSDRQTILEGLINGRGAVMPAFAGRLDETALKALAVYVHALGGGEK